MQKKEEEGCALHYFSQSVAPPRFSSSSSSHPLVRLPVLLLGLLAQDPHLARVRRLAPVDRVRDGDELPLEEGLPPPLEGDQENLTSWPRPYQRQTSFAARAIALRSGPSTAAPPRRIAIGMEY